jgi:hypothetical protein
MKKMIAVVLSVAALGAAAQVKNSDFNDDFSTNTWGSWKSDKAAGEFLHDKASGNKAPGALEIKVGPENPIKEAFVFTKAFPAQPGKTYKASVYALGKGIAPNSEVSIAFQGQTAEGAWLGTEVNKTSMEGSDLAKWRAMSITFTVPSTGSWKNTGRLFCSLGISNTASGQVFFDDFAFSEVSPSDGYKDGFDSAPWGNWKSEGGIGKFILNPNVGNKAPGALEISLGPNNPLKAGFSFLKALPVKAGKTYNMLIYVQGKNLPADAQIGMNFQGQNTDKAFLGTGVQGAILTGGNVPSDEWKRMVFTFKVPETEAWKNVGFLLCTLGISNAASGQIFFDDFEFFEEKGNNSDGKNSN